MQAQAQPPVETDISTQISRVALYVLLIILAIAILFPFYWMVATSLKRIRKPSIIRRTSIRQKPTLEHYHEIMTRGDINVPRWGWNSLVIAVATTVVTLFVTSLAAYGFRPVGFPLQESDIHRSYFHADDSFADLHDSQLSCWCAILVGWIAITR